jgi:eukaryotic-like serine/threonine-protein kinase
MVAVDEPLPREEIFAGKYRIERVIGTGAMGVVAAAKHVELDELRAIKFMLPSARSGPRSIERFLREARAAVRLKSQHVVKVHDMGRLRSGTPYIVMEYLEGMDLKRHLSKRGPLRVGDAVLYIIQACEAIAEAHAAGIVHRNLFLTRAARGAPCIKVLDFGIAKLTSSTSEEITGTSISLGTPSYMSPEQLRSTRSVDARSDVWSLGVVLYVMITGRRPFTGEGYMGIRASVMANSATPPSRFRPGLPREVEAIVMRCLEKAPARRYQSAADLAMALAPFLPMHHQSIDVAGSLRALGSLRSTPHNPGKPEATSGSPIVEPEENTLAVLTPSAIDVSECSGNQLSPGAGATNEQGRQLLPPRSFAAVEGIQTQQLSEAAPATRDQPTPGLVGNVDEVEVDLTDTLVLDQQQVPVALAGTAHVLETGEVTVPTLGSWVRATVPTRRDLSVRAVHGGVLAAIVFGTAVFGFVAAREPPGPAPESSARPVAQPVPAAAPAPSAAPSRKATGASSSDPLRRPPTAQAAGSAGPVAKAALRCAPAARPGTQCTGSPRSARSPAAAQSRSVDNPGIERNKCVICASP